MQRKVKNSRNERSPFMENIIVGGILVVLVGGAIWYIIREKKKGVRCIGCPSAGKCSSKNGQSCTCCNGHSKAGDKN